MSAIECEVVSTPSQHTVFTPERQARFIENLRLTGGNISKACEASNVSRPTAYTYRNTVPMFREAWDEALEASIEQLEQEARRRALEGVNEPVFYKGDVCGVIRKYSDTLAIFLLQAHRPEKYRDNFHNE